jgi:DNA-binding LacI/PurR family transcriptional regulator/anti-anti-sigma regulatory factor
MTSRFEPPPNMPTIGYITPQTHSNYLRTLLTSVQQTAREHGAPLVVFQTTPHTVVTSHLGRDVVDGWIAIFYSGRYDMSSNDKALATLVRLGRPLVTISQEVRGAPVVATDNVGGMSSVVRHLIDLGHQRIAFIGIANNPDTPSRFEGYRQALLERSIPFDPALVLSTPDGEFESGCIAAQRLVADGIPCTAAAFCNDYNALGALEALRSAGVRVPDDLAITGFDDVPEAQIAVPRLTTVRMRLDAMGRAAVEQLLDMLARGPTSVEMIRIPTALVVRRSAGERMAPVYTNPGLDATADLARRLVEIVGAPAPLGPDEPPDYLWPGVSMLVQAVESALADGPPPVDGTIQQVWHAALHTTADADPLEDALSLIEKTFEARLADRPADDPTRTRAAATMQRLRTALLRVCIGWHARQVNQSERSLFIIDQVGRALADTDLEATYRLGWLSHTDVLGGALALWEGGPADAMNLIGRYRDVADAAPRPIVAEQFPPLDLLSQQGHPLVTVLPLQSGRRDWGALALALPDEQDTSALDNASLIAVLLSTRIDSLTSQRDLEQQQAVIRDAYERERALSEAVRELGCPVIPLGSAALLIPLVGLIDSRRAQQIISTALGAIETYQAHKLLLDVSGVPLIDTHVAGMLVQLAQMAALLGAQAILIGVRPEIAQSIVGLGIDLGNLAAHSSLAEVLATLWPGKDHAAKKASIETAWACRAAAGPKPAE